VGRRKQAHFAEMAAMPRVWEHPEHCAGQWRSLLAKPLPRPDFAQISGDPSAGPSSDPAGLGVLTLELGCGTGLWTVGMAEKFREQWWIGADIKGARMWHGAKLLQSKGLANAGFLRTRLEQIEKYFAGGEVNEIWITFPDPQPRESREKKRLTSPTFLRRYRNIMHPDGRIHLKTDNLSLFEYTLQAWQAEGLCIERCIRDIHSPEHMEQRDPNEQNVLSFITTYESRYMAQSLPIQYLRAAFRKGFPGPVPAFGRP
jgi:tRNA (guanine-N7-)-methyltransferase